MIPLLVMLVPHLVLRFEDDGKPFDLRCAPVPEIRAARSGGKPARGWVGVALSIPLWIALGAPALQVSGEPLQRLPVPGGSYRVGKSRELRKKVLDLCRATSSDKAKCGPEILHDEAGHVRQVLVDFQIDRLEVSQSRFRECVAAGACTPPDELECRYGDGSTPAAEALRILKKEDHPAVCVTFEQARAFCRWRGGDLPEEAQWEKAAGGDRLFPWGNEWDPERANWGDDGKVDGYPLTSPVGSFPKGASPHGVQDLVGNVWEWAIRLPALDPPEAAGKQVIRGGGFAAPPHAQRVHKRVPYDPVGAYPNVGFRCAYFSTEFPSSHRP
jgi:formylglycine-generating enzyme required for sulfatase activity